MSYLNPANTGVSLPQMPLGPLSGFLTGMRIDTGNEMDKRMMRDDDLEYAINQIRQQQDQSNLAVLQANNQNALSGAAITAGQYADGTKQQEADTGSQATIAGNQLKTTQSQDEIRRAVAPDVVNMGEYIKANGGQLDPTNQADIDRWNQFSTVMQNHGIKVPTFPDQGDTIQLQQWAKNAAKYASTNAQATINTIPYQQELGKIQAQSQGAQTVEAQRATSAETVADKQVAGGIQRAQIAANAQIEKSQIYASVSKTAKDNLLTTLQMIRRKGGVTPEDVPMLQQMAFNAFYDQAGTFRAINFNTADPATQARIRQAQQFASQEAEEFLRKDPSYIKAEQASGATNTNQPQSTNQPTTNNQPRNLILSSGQGLPSDLRPGDVINGHTYLGGPHNSQSSWK